MRRLPVVLAMAVALALFAAACSGDDSGDSDAGGSSDAAAAPVTTITSVATDNKFDKRTYTIPAGQEVTLTLDNKGAAVHNFHIKAEGADGKNVTTTLLPGGQSETIKFRIAKAGTYDFLCDVHPVEMVGKITVA